MKFTYYTIIGKDVNLLKGHIQNIKEYAGFNKLTCEKEIIVIVYRNDGIPEHITEGILEYCKSEDIRTVMYDEPDNVFITNLYACWNLGYKVADDGYVFRGGSDQVFSKDSFVALYEQAERLRTENPDGKYILQANTMENAPRLAQIGAISRHFALDMGATFDEFKYDEFEAFLEKINEPVKEKLLTIDQCLAYWGKPTQLRTSLGIINRVDGCSWLMTKKDWEEHGPLPVLVNGVTGDVIIHDKLQVAGYQELLVRDCSTYHFVRGESIEVQ